VQGHASLSRRVVLGAALGITVGALFVGVGLVRAVMFLLGGGRLDALDGDDLRTIAYYVGGFGVGGALFGALKPVLRGKIGIYAGCMLVGVIVMLAIGLSDKGNLGAFDAFDWLALPGLGMLFGAAAAYGWTRSPD
jgi:peptidoglycan/LPS O-acetylase OafA/YrhL